MEEHYGRLIRLFGGRKVSESVLICDPAAELILVQPLPLVSCVGIS